MREEIVERIKEAIANGFSLSFDRYADNETIVLSIVSGDELIENLGAIETL